MHPTLKDALATALVNNALKKHKTPIAKLNWYKRQLGHTYDRYWRFQKEKLSLPHERYYIDKINSLHAIGQGWGRVLHGQTMCVYIPQRVYYPVKKKVEGKINVIIFEPGGRGAVFGSVRQQTTFKKPPVDTSAKKDIVADPFAYIEGKRLLPENALIVSIDKDTLYARVARNAKISQDKFNVWNNRTTTPNTNTGVVSLAELKLLLLQLQRSGKSYASSSRTVSDKRARVDNRNTADSKRRRSSSSSNNSSSSSNNSKRRRRLV